MAKKDKEDEAVSEKEVAAVSAEAGETEDSDGEGEEEGFDSGSSDDVPSDEAPKKKPRGRKEKKAVKKRKSSKEKENPLARAVRLTVETGKVAFGSKTGVKDALLARAKLIVIAKNAAPELREDVAYYAKLSSVPLIVYDGTSIELGSICGKPYPVSVLSVYEAGSSDILEIAKKK